MSEDFRTLPDLARRDLGGSVLWASDELFAAADNLINPGPSMHDRDTFGPRGKIYDGWESRRRRQMPTADGSAATGSETEGDEVIIRLSVPGIVRGVVIDTAFFTGNFPPFASVEGLTLLDYPSLAEVRAAEWTPLLSRSELEGDTSNTFVVFAHERLVTHVRLRIYPDGGVARFRVHCEAVPDPRFMGGRVDLAAALNGGRITGCSNMFYSSPGNLLAPGRASVMSDGWETARRRNGGNDWVSVSLAAPADLHDVVVDTTRFVGNASGWIRLSDADTDRELLPLTRLQPDAEQRFRLTDATGVSQVRLDAYPDGGLSRLRVNGEITAAGRAQATSRWLGLLPEEIAGSLDQKQFFD
jgi:allantoicase